MSANGEQIVFPWRTGQKHVVGTSWGNFISDYGLSEILCAYLERFNRVGTSPPSISLTYAGEVVMLTEDIQEFVTWVSKRPFTDVLNSLVLQLHTNLLLLAGKYYTEDTVPHTADTLRGIGLTLNPSWPEGIIALREFFPKINYTRTEVSGSQSVSLANIYLPAGFPYVTFPIPLTGHPNSLDESSATLGEVGIQAITVGQRVETLLLEQGRLCFSGWMKPCLPSAYQLALQPTEIQDATWPYPLDYASLDLHYVSYEFTVTNLYEYYRQFLVSDSSLRPYRAYVKELRLNGKRLPPLPNIPWDISNIIKCGVNTLSIIYYGSASWSSFKVAQLLPVDYPISLGTGIAKVNDTCWEPIGIKPWLLNDFIMTDTVEFSAHSVIPNAFECYPPPQDKVIYGGDVTVSTPNPIQDQTFTFRFSTPLGATKYIAYLECYPKALQKDTERHGITHKVSEGSCEGIVIGEAKIPIDSTVVWKLVIYFNNNVLPLKTNVINYGAIWGDNDPTPVVGSVGQGVSCCEGPYGYDYGYAYSYYGMSYCSPPSGMGECSPIYLSGDLRFFPDCGTCGIESEEYGIEFQRMHFTENTPPEGASDNLLLYVYGSVAAGEYVAEYSTSGRTGTWVNVTSPRYGLIGGSTTVLVDYEADEGNETLATLSLPHSNDLVVNLGQYISSGDPVTVSTTPI